MGITIEDAGKILSRSPTRVRKFLTEGRIQGEKVGRDWVVDEASLVAYKLTLASPITEALRREILGRDGKKCQDCGWEPEGEYQTRRLHVHHIVERDNGGQNDPGNLVTLCWQCHLARHPKEKGLAGRSVWLPIEIIAVASKVTDGSNGQIADFLLALCEKNGVEVAEFPKTAAQRKSRIENLTREVRTLRDENYKLKANPPVQTSVGILSAESLTIAQWGVLNKPGPKKKDVK